MTDKVVCWACDGKGKKWIPGNGTASSPPHWEHCSLCDGSGKTEPRVPPGPDDDVIIPAG